MEHQDYKKYKDSKPADTLFKIQSILHETGLVTTHEWVDNEYEGCYSNRVNIYPTQLGTNGKGTDRIYSLTSGYAELMERIQNSILYVGELSEEDKQFGGFLHFPDQRLVPFKTILEDNTRVISHFFEEIGCENDYEKIKVLKDFANIKNGTEKEALCIPFVDLEQGRVVYLPQDMLIALYGSNGMSAGNTMEEALVQGIAEVFERYVNRKIALEHICPPSVPRSYIKTIPSLNAVINEIEKDGRYQVIVKDCSLGRNFPVAAIIIINKCTGTFGVKFASHPSFSVALERTLTEAFQGKKLEQFTAANVVGADEQIQQRDNVLNMMKIGNGAYPKELLVGTPDYDFTPFDERECQNNRDMLKFMIGLIRKEGYSLYIHDSSYLGFHSYFAIVPGMSEIYPTDSLRIREQLTYVRLVESLGHIHSLTDEEAKRIITFTSFKELSLLENQITWVSGRPFNNKFPGKDAATVLLKACCLYQIGDYIRSAREMARVSEYFDTLESEEDKEFFRCCKAYIYYRAIGLDTKDCAKLIKTLYKDAVADKVIDMLSDPKLIMSKMYPDMKCYDCVNCELDKNGICQYRDVSEVIRKIKAALKKNVPDQGKLLKELSIYI